MARKPDFTVPVHPGMKFAFAGVYGTASASDLDEGGRRPIASRVWRDSADIGFRVLSPRTGREVLFVLASETRHEGDLVSEKFVSYGLVPQVQIIIYND